MVLELKVATYNLPSNYGGKIWHVRPPMMRHECVPQCAFSANTPTLILSPWQGKAPQQAANTLGKAASNEVLGQIE